MMSNPGNNHIDPQNLDNRNKTVKSVPQLYGTTQIQRYLPALMPQYVLPDERSTRDMIRFIQHIAHFMPYYNEKNEPDGNWGEFFQDLFPADNHGHTWEQLFAPDNNPYTLTANHPPHQALFIAFLKLFDRAQQQLNQLPRRNLDFYYQQLLGFKPRLPKPDTAIVCCTLAPNTPDFVISPQTLFATPQPGAPELLYQPLDITVLNHARIQALKTLFLDKNSAIPHANTLAQTADDLAKHQDLQKGSAWALFGNNQHPKANLGFALASPVLQLSGGTRTITLTLQLANKIDYFNPFLQLVFDEFCNKLNNIQSVVQEPKTGKEYTNEVSQAFDTFKEALQDLIEILKTATEKLSALQTFFKEKYNTEEAVKKLNNLIAELENPGNTIQYDANNNNADEQYKGLQSNIKEWIDKSSTFIEQFKKTEVLVPVLKNPLAISLTTEKEWVNIADKNIEATLLAIPVTDSEKKEKEMGINTKVIIQFTLPSDFPPFANYTEEAHQCQYSTAYPVLQCLVNQEGSKYYPVLRHMQILGIQLHAEVKDFDNLILQNDLGVLDATKPIAIFGAEPVLGANFYIGSHEVFSKKLESLNVNIEWRGLPDSFKQHYKGYKDLNNNGWEKPIAEFKVKTALLNKAEWDGGEESNLFGKLKDKEQPKDEERLTKSSIDIQTTISLANAYPHLPQFDRYTQQLNRGFLRLTLSNPPYAFGHGLYTHVYTATVINIGKTNNLAEGGAEFDINKLVEQKLQEIANEGSVSKELIKWFLKNVCNSLGIEYKEDYTNSNNENGGEAIWNEFKKKIKEAVENKGKSIDDEIQKLNDFNNDLSTKVVELINNLNDIINSLPPTQQQHTENTDNTPESSLGDKLNELQTKLSKIDTGNTPVGEDQQDNANDIPPCEEELQSIKNIIVEVNELIEEIITLYNGEVTSKTVFINSLEEKLRRISNFANNLLTINNTQSENLNNLLNQLNDLKNIIDNENNPIQLHINWLNELKNKLSLDGKEKDEEYIAIITKLISDYNNAIKGVVKEHTKIPIPQKPYTPTADKISIDYTAVDTVFFTPSKEQPPKTASYTTCLHLHPFGFETYSAGNHEEEIEKSVAALSNYCKEDKQPLLIPCYKEEEGSMYIAITKAQTLQNITLYFHFEPYTAANLDTELPKPEWRYLSNNQWKPLGLHLLSDGTKGFSQSGIVTLQLPHDATANNTLLLPSGNFWLSVSVKKDAATFNKLRYIQTNAVAVQLQMPAHAATPPPHLAEGLPPQSIKFLAVRQAGITEVLQPFSSINGAAPETDDHFYVRVSERLRHKNRCVKVWDTEHWILENFSQIWAVKCIDNGYHRQIVCVPYPHTNQPYQPLCPYALRRQIESAVATVSSPLMETVVVNPCYAFIGVTCKVAFTPNADRNYSERQLKQFVAGYLSPFNEKRAPRVNAFRTVKDLQTTERELLLNELVQLDYVQEVKDLVIAAYKDIDLQQELTDNDLSASPQILVISRFHPNNNNIILKSHQTEKIVQDGIEYLATIERNLLVQ